MAQPSPPPASSPATPTPLHDAVKRYVNAVRFATAKALGAGADDALEAAGSGLQRNVARDADTTARLEAVGWTVLRFWEHEDLHEVAREIASTVRGLPN